MASCPERDFVGYGARPPRIRWPGGHRLALSIVVNYEEGGERCVLDGDAESETLNSDAVGAVSRAGGRNLAVESHYEYGSRVGFWRIQALLAGFRVPATYFVVSSAIERHPQAARAIVEAGHEVVCHGQRWIDYAGMPIETEREHVRGSLDSIERLCGVRPRGWYTGRVSQNTRRLAVEAGMTYDSDAYNDDLPYWVDVDGRDHLVVPYSFDCNDMRFASAPGFNTPDDFLRHLVASFDCLYRESAHGPKMMSVGLHLRLAGRPARTEALRRFFEHVRRHDGVWLCARGQIADHWAQACPPAARLA